MLERPVFKELYRVAVVRGEGVLLLSDRGDHVLCGRVYEHLAPWLTGGYSSDEIVARLAARHGAAPLYYALAELEERGYLGEPEKTVQSRLKSGRPTWSNPTEKNGKFVWYTSTVGGDPRIVDVILQRVAEAARLPVTG